MRLFPGSKPPAATYRRAVKNIRATFVEAPSELRDWGAYWYQRAHWEAKWIAFDAKIPLKAACHLLAVLSPSNRWENNLKDAKRLVKAITSGQPYHSFSVSTYGRNKQTAWEIVRLARRGDDFTKVLSGPKVKSFADNIEFPLKDQEVTIDFHAYSIAVGWKFGTKTVPEITDKIYAMLRKAYTEVGKEFGLKGHQIQAATWVWWRKKKGT